MWGWDVGEVGGDEVRGGGMGWDGMGGEVPPPPPFLVSPQVRQNAAGRGVQIGPGAVHRCGAVRCGSALRDPRLCPPSPRPPLPSSPSLTDEMKRRREFYAAYPVAEGECPPMGSPSPLPRDPRLRPPHSPLPPVPISAQRLQRGPRGGSAARRDAADGGRHRQSVH